MIVTVSDLRAVLVLLPSAEHVHDAAILGTDWSSDIPLRQQTTEQHRSQKVHSVLYSTLSALHHQCQCAISGGV